MKLLTVLAGMILLAAANVAFADEPAPPQACGLEDTRGPGGQPCPSQPWYDEEGELQGGLAQGH